MKDTSYVPILLQLMIMICSYHLISRSPLTKPVEAKSKYLIMNS